MLDMRKGDIVTLLNTDDTDCECRDRLIVRYTHCGHRVDGPNQHKARVDPSKLSQNAVSCILLTVLLFRFESYALSACQSNLVLAEHDFAALYAGSCACTRAYPCTAYGRLCVYVFEARAFQFPAVRRYTIAVVDFAAYLHCTVLYCVYAQHVANALPLRVRCSLKSLYDCLQFCCVRRWEGVLL
jgi:hypothetical protein